MKLFIIPAWYPQNKDDITASFFREQAHALADNGHDVTVIHIEPVSFSKLLRQPKHDIRLWQDGNVRTIFHKVIVPIPGKFADAQDKYISKLFYKIIQDQIEKDKAEGLSGPDILHAHVSHSCAYYCLYAKEKLNIPLVVTEHYSGLLLGTANER
jgi:glycosyltransferase involved in cell wall biosynthesis